MLQLLKSTPTVLCDRISRRDWLRVGGLGILGLSLPNLLRAEDARRRQGSRTSSAKCGRANACILIYLAGGPSQPDMWDMKPALPVEFRGEFKPIATTVPGIQMCEHLPHVARQAHHATIIRSAHHNVGHAHCAASYFVLTGEDRGDSVDAFGARPIDFPGIGAVLTRFRPPKGAIVPYVTAPYVMTEGIGGPPSPGIYGGWVGHAHHPVEGHPPPREAEGPHPPKFGLPDPPLPAAGGP